MIGIIWEAARWCFIIELLVFVYLSFCIELKDLDICSVVLLECLREQMSFPVRAFVLVITYMVSTKSII
jgi:hypothetical protein